MPTSIRYKTDSKNGPEFQKISKTQGWVEYLNTLGQVYCFPSISQDCYTSRRQDLINNMPRHLENFNKSDHLGWINHLAQQRLIEKFILPLFGTIDAATGKQHVQCGNSRIDASIMCGISHNEIPMIAFSASRKQLSVPAERLTSTEQFNTIFGLNSIDYRIVFDESDSSEITFMNSVLRHTIYEGSPQTATHYSSKTNDCIDFWKKFQTEDMKFEIQIHCTPETQSFVVPSDLFKIEYINRDANEWELSYGMMLGAFNEKVRNAHSRSKLQLWLYDVTEPVNLELIIPWMTSRHNFYKTQNEKAVVIYGENQSNGLQVIGNWLK
jgi:hypothetical protein